MSESDFDNNDHSLVDVDPLAYEEAQLAAAIAASLAEMAQVPSVAGSSTTSRKRTVDVISIGSSSGSTSPHLAANELADVTSKVAFAQLDSAGRSIDEVSVAAPSGFINERVELEKARLERLKRRREETGDTNSQTPGAGPSTVKARVETIERPTKKRCVVLPSK